MSLKILIVEDDPTSREIIKASLRTDGYILDEAKDGIAAYESALVNPPNLVLMDVKMPGWSGYEACQAFRSNQVLAKIPIIFVTGATNEIENAFNAGGVDYINKPIRPTELTMRVNFHLERTQALRKIEILNLEGKRAIEQKNAELAQKSRLLREALEEIEKLKSQK